MTSVCTKNKSLGTQFTESLLQNDISRYRMSKTGKKHKGTSNSVLGDTKEDCLCLGCIVEVLGDICLY